MIKVTIKATYRPLRLQSLGLTRAQMLALGQLGISTIKSRVARGIGSDDSPMPALNPSYAKAKRRAGLPAVRDLRGTGRQGGHMLDSLSIRSATDNSVRMDITSQSARDKAAANEKRFPFYGWSPSDAADILEAAQQMARGNIREVTGDRGLSVWADPYRLRSRGFRTAG